MSPLRHTTRFARRRFLGLVLAAPLAAPLMLAACGDDSTVGSPAPTAGGSTLPPAGTDGPSPGTTPPGAIDHPTGADDVVLWIGYEGGFVPVEIAFQHLPALLVTGDGRVVQQGPQIEIHPGPLLPNLQQRTITEGGVQELLALAAEHGLFEAGDYEGPEATVADAAHTVVRISANGTTIEHRAYALDIDPDVAGSEDRARLAAFVERATDLQTAVAADALGAEEPYEADSYRIRATVVTDDSGYEIEPTVVDWPSTASVRLADAVECAVVPADEAAPVFTGATQLTWFRDGDVTYQVAVVPSLPGESC
jgi:hypothetical protein